LERDSRIEVLRYNVGLEIVFDAQYQRKRLGVDCARSRDSIATVNRFEPRNNSRLWIFVTRRLWGRG